MGRKCSVFGCNSNFDSKRRGKRGKKCGKNKSAYVKVFRFPPTLKESKIWVKRLPNDDLKVGDITKNVVVCVKHWRHLIGEVLKRNCSYEKSLWRASCAKHTSGFIFC